MKFPSVGSISHRTKTAVALVGLGVIALGWFGLQKETQVKPIPYSKILLEEGSPSNFPDLGLKDAEGVIVRKYELRAEGIDRPLAEFHIAQKDDALPVPVSWKNNLAEPMLIPNIEPDATKKIAETIAKHLPKDATVMGWWDISRGLNLYENISVEFGKATAGPIFVPTIWSENNQEITEKEQDFWRNNKTSSLQSVDKKFLEFTDALVMDASAGADALQKVVDGKRAFLVLNILDSYKIGAMYPGKFNVGFKDFPRTEQSHGLIKGVKAWVKENKFAAYSLYPLDKTVIRVFFLSDEASKNSIIAKLLPFNTSKPGQVAGTRLVYQHRGYWVYELTGAETASN